MLQAVMAMASATKDIFGAGGDALAIARNRQAAGNTGPQIANQSGGAVGAAGLGQMAGKATQALKAFSGPAGMVVDAFKQVYETGVQVADQQLESNRELQKFSAAIHTSYVNLEIARIENQTKLAAATEKSASALAEAQQHQEQQLLAGEAGMADWSNKFGKVFKDMQTGVKKLWYDITGATAHGKSLLEKQRNAKTPAQATLDVLEQMARGQLGNARKRKPIEMPPR